jgi:hypothetical protein
MGALAATAQADQWDHGHHGFGLIPGNLLLSTSDYSATSITPGVTELPPGCTGSNCAPAIASGTYPEVFKNETVDASFGVTSRVFLDELTPWGQVIDRIAVPDRDLVTSFSSKSELALNLSTNGQDLTFMGTRRRSAPSTCRTRTLRRWSTRPTRCPAPITAWSPISVGTGSSSRSR